MQNEISTEILACSRTSRLTQALFFPPNRLTYFAFFRVFVAAHVLFKISTVWPFAHLLYSGESFCQHGDDFSYLGILPLEQVRGHLSLFFGLYMIVAILVAFGVGKHLTMLVLALFTDITQCLNSYVLDGGDNLLKFILFYLVFANCYSGFCLKPLQCRCKTLRLLSNFLTRCSLFSIVFHLCVVYLVSGISKAHSEVWYNGIGIYYIFMGERFQGTAWNATLGKNAYFTTFGCYFTIIWESCFCAAVFLKRLRLFWLLLGTGMHAGIYFFMMIHEFSWFFVSLYGFFITDAEWKLTGKKLRYLWIKASQFGRDKNEAMHSASL